jgi:hypothetical protein
MDELKWIIVLTVVFLVIPALLYVHETNAHQHCRLEMAKLNKTVEEIQQLCK